MHCPRRLSEICKNLIWENHIKCGVGHNFFGSVGCISPMDGLGEQSFSKNEISWEVAARGAGEIACVLPEARHYGSERELGRKRTCRPDEPMLRVRRK